jgi:glycosyltransferase involved in cell wall biosynthesis
VRWTALVESPQHVCCRYRLTAFRPFVERAGFHLELQPWPRRWWQRLQTLGRLRHADGVIIQRKLLRPWYLALLRRVAPALLFDFDDAVFLRDSYSPRGLHSAGRQRLFRSMVQAADGIIAGNAFLSEQAAAFAPKCPIHIIPTCVDTDRYPLAQHQATGSGVQLVWIGSSSTLQGLEAISSWLEQTAQRWPDLRLKMICDRFLQLQRLPVLPCPWSEATEAAELAAADIGLSWLPDDLWSRGKCGLKVLQYMAAGLPVVANPVGVQAEFIQHGQTGFLVQTPAQWVEAIGCLAQDPDLRRRMGLAARRRVEAEFSVTAGAASWLSLLQGLRRREVA